MRNKILFLTLLAVSAAPLLAASAEVIAVVNGKPITSVDIESRVAGSLLSLQQREYEIKLAAAKTIALQRLRAAEAARRGISVDELTRLEVDAKVPQPSEEEINMMLRYLAARLPKDPAAARAAVVASMRQQKIDEMTTQFDDALLARAGFEMRIVPPRAKIAVAANDAVRGDAAAPITIVEFSDFQCPYCGRAQEALREVQKKYGQSVRLVFKQFPIEQIHDRARMAAEASLCARDQNKFWELHDWLFANVQTMSRDTIVAAAPALGMDGPALGKCIDGHLHAKDVDSDFAIGQQIGVNGTPSFFVNGRLLSANAFNNFRDVIDDELRRK